MLASVAAKLFGTRWGRRTLVAVIGAAGLLPGALAYAASGPAQFNVNLGYEDQKQGFEYEGFLPDTVVIDAGDSIVFTLRSHEPHTVTLNAVQPLPAPFLPASGHGLEGNPVLFNPSPPPAGPMDPDAPVRLSVTFDGHGYVNSGFLKNPGDSLAVTFTTPGTYQILCLLHPDHMKGTITVQPAGATRPWTDADYRAREQAQVDRALAQGSKLLASLPAPAPVTNADGSRTWSVYAGLGDSQDGIDYMRFIGGEKLTIRAGDAVTFFLDKNSQGVPHTITLLSGDDDPELIIPQPQPAGPPVLLVNPRVAAPAPIPPAPYTGTGYYNSGLLLTGGPTPQSYTVTFTRPGTFQYQCILHDEDGMKGTIVVQ